MKKSGFLKKVAVSRLKYEASLELIHTDQMELPGVSGDMSVKDIIAHVAWYEREMVVLLSDMTLAGSVLWGHAPDERNEAILAASRAKSLGEIQTDAEAVYAQLVGLLGRMAEAALTDPAHFRDMPADWIPWEMIAGNTYEHYEAHADDILSWLGK